MDTNFLSKYDSLLRNWAIDKINSKFTFMGSPLRLMGRKNTVEELKALTDMKIGHLWIVGQEDDEEKTEYVYTEFGWELMSTTAASLEGYVSDENLYKGSDGTGTPENPVEGTILSNYFKVVKLNTDKIDSINDSETGILVQSKQYSDTLVAEDTEIVGRISSLETAVEDDEISAMFTENTDIVIPPEYERDESAEIVSVPSNVTLTDNISIGTTSGTSAYTDKSVTFTISKKAIAVLKLDGSNSYNGQSGGYSMNVKVLKFTNGEYLNDSVMLGEASGSGSFGTCVGTWSTRTLDGPIELEPGSYRIHVTGHAGGMNGGGMNYTVTLELT